MVRGESWYDVVFFLVLLLGNALSHVSHVNIPRPDTPDNLSSRSPAVPSTPLPHPTGHHCAVVCAVGRSTCWGSPITRGLWQYVGEGLDERSRVDCFGFISSLLMAGRRRFVTRRSSHATLDGALLAPSPRPGSGPGGTIECNMRIIELSFTLDQTERSGKF